jgi:hypothetical protein
MITRPLSTALYAVLVPAIALLFVLSPGVADARGSAGKPASSRRDAALGAVEVSSARTIVGSSAAPKASSAPAVETSSVRVSGPAGAVAR